MLYDPLEPANILKSGVTGQQIVGNAVGQQRLYCKHEIVAEWCATCKHDNPASIKVVLKQENLAIVRNLATWEKKKPTT